MWSRSTAYKVVKINTRHQTVGGILARDIRNLPTVILSLFLIWVATCDFQLCGILIWSLDIFVTLQIRD